MFETLKRLYGNGNGPLDEKGLNNAVSKSWITEEQEREILGLQESG